MAGLSLERKARFLSFEVLELGYRCAPAPSRFACQRRRCASAIGRDQPRFFEPVYNPPWKRQRAFPSSTLN